MTLEKKKIDGFVSLDEIVYSYKNWEGDFSMKDFFRYKNLVIEGFSDLNIQDFRKVDVEYLTINSDTNTAVVPNSFVKESKVGLVFDNRVYILTENKNINIAPKESCGEITRTSGGGTDTVRFVGHYRGNGFVEGLYGIKGGLEDAYYKISDDGVIYFEGTIPDNVDVILEFVSSGIDITGRTTVPLYIKPVLVAYLNWKLSEKDKNSNESQRNRYMNLYGVEIRRMKKVRQRYNLQQYISAMWRSMSQTVNR